MEKWVKSMSVGLFAGAIALSCMGQRAIAQTSPNVSEPSEIRQSQDEASGAGGAADLTTTPVGVESGDLVPVNPEPVEPETVEFGGLAPVGESFFWWEPGNRNPWVQMELDDLDE